MPSLVIASGELFLAVLPPHFTEPLTTLFRISTFLTQATTGRLKASKISKFQEDIS